MKWKEGILKADNTKLPQYQQPFQVWLKENVDIPSGPQCAAGCCQWKPKQGSNATHKRFMCTVCGHIKSIPRDEILDLSNLNDPETCPHGRLTRLGSSKNFVNYFCMDCRTSIERVTREQAKYADEVAKQLLLASNRVQNTVEKLTKDPDLHVRDAMAVVRIFEQQASAQIAAAGENGRILTSELVSTLQDIVDGVLMSAAGESTVFPDNDGLQPFSGASASVGFMVVLEPEER